MVIFNAQNDKYRLLPKQYSGLNSSSSRECQYFRREKKREKVKRTMGYFRLTCTYLISHLYIQRYLQDSRVMVKEGLAVLWQAASIKNTWRTGQKKRSEFCKCTGRLTRIKVRHALSPLLLFKLNVSFFFFATTHLIKCPACQKCSAFSFDQNDLNIRHAGILTSIIKWM